MTTNLSPLQERVLAAYMQAKVAKGDWPQAEDVATAIGSTRAAVYQSLCKIRQAGLAIGPGSGRWSSVDRESQILKAMADLRETNDDWPTLEEIGHAIGMTKSGVKNYMDRMVASGRVRMLGVRRGYALPRNGGTT